ncbi:MAG: hypothetical protein HC808_02995 [Candidatus Competibacteraceae bacterium]|nr:hypothetical protein [Candidatus Competibacteraceae bacterium]
MPLMVLRAVHGAAFAVLLVANTALFTTVVPASRGHGLRLLFDGEAARQYAVSSVMMLGALALIPWIGTIVFQIKNVADKAASSSVG